MCAKRLGINLIWKGNGLNEKGINILDANRISWILFGFKTI